MPIIRVEMVAGRSVEQKRELAEALTRETARIANTSPASIFVIFEDVAKEDWAIGGALIADK
jgi:4-oxalocrotonate tautomerase